MLVGIDKRTTVQHLLETTCNKRQLNPRDHYVRIKPLGSMDDKFVVPERHQLVKQLVRIDIFAAKYRSKNSVTFLMVITLKKH